LVPGFPLSLIDFPADDPERARPFWVELLGVELEARQEGEGEGWQTYSGAPVVGVHARGTGPGDSFSLPYFAVSDIAKALEHVEALGGSVVHPGERYGRSARTPREPVRNSKRAVRPPDEKRRLPEQQR
jgi:predicted enzyme related to lactoylglutathione lyase